MSQTQAKKEGRFIEDPEIMNTMWEPSIAHSFLYGTASGQGRYGNRSTRYLYSIVPDKRQECEFYHRRSYLAKLLVQCLLPLVRYHTSTTPVRCCRRMRTVIVLKSTHDRGVHHPRNHEKLREKTLHAALLGLTSYHS